MKLTIFKAGDGDCFLIDDGTTHVLVDGGRTGSYTNHVSKRLNELHENGHKLDRVCISHIDDDHISGVLRLLDDKVAWKVHRHQRDTLHNDAHTPPEALEPPDIGAVWHNGFSDIDREQSGDIVDELATRVRFLSHMPGDGETKERIEAEAWHNLISGEASALRVRRRVSEGQLDIKVNPERDRHVMGLFDNQQPFKVGDLSLAMIGPYFEDLETLRKAWQKWLKKNDKTVEKIREQARKDEQRLGLTDIGAWLNRMRLFQSEIGNVEDLTPPNVASIMFLAEQGGKSILMTGDGGWDVILSGLGHAGKLRADDTLHVDVLKVQHHGSENNTSVEFTQKITADHYVFSANGSHHNPDIEVVEAYLKSRVGTARERSGNDEVGNDFTLWFTYGPNDDLTDRQASHMKKVRDLVETHRAANPGRITVNFLEVSHEEIAL